MGITDSIIKKFEPVFNLIEKYYIILIILAAVAIFLFLLNLAGFIKVKI